MLLSAAVFHRYFPQPHPHYNVAFFRRHFLRFCRELRFQAAQPHLLGFLPRQHPLLHCFVQQLRHHHRRSQLHSHLTHLADLFPKTTLSFVLTAHFHDLKWQNADPEALRPQRTCPLPSDTPLAPSRYPKAATL